MKLVRSACRAATQLWRWPRVRTELRRMAASPRCRPVADAVQAVLDGRFSREDTAWIERIEALREKTLARNDIVQWRAFETGPDGEVCSRLVPRAVGEVCRVGSKAHKWAVLLFMLVRRLRPCACLELGTCVGISGAFQAAALHRNGAGRLASLEGSEELVAVAEENWSELGLAEQAASISGHFGATLAGALRDHGPFDYVFVDGHHDEQATWDYYQQVLPHLVEGAAIVFDDITWSAGMRRVWKRIRHDPHVDVAVDLHTIGLVLYRADGAGDQYRLTI